MTLPAPPHRPPAKGRAAAAVAVTVLAWASAFPLIHVGLRGLPPLPLAAARFSVAALLALAWLAVARPVRPSRQDALRVLACGLVGIALYNGLLNTGQRTVPAGAASFILNLGPLFTAVLAARLLAERLPPLGWAGSAVSMAGVALIAADQPGGTASATGIAAILGAALAQAVYFVLQRPLVPRYGAGACTAYTLVAGAAFLAPWLPEAARRVAEPGADPAVVAAVVALGVVPAALGYAAWTYALGQLGAARAANALYLVPPTATLLAIPMLGEWPGAGTLLGGAVASAGVAIVVRSARR